MNNLVVAALLSLAPVALALVLLYRKLSSQPDSEVAVDQCLVLSLEKYRPMERLLQEDDFRFLAAQPGFSPQLGRRFRTERRRIFRSYLRNLRRDFSRLSSAFRILIVHSVEDRGDLAKSLMRMRVMFALGMLAVEGRLLMHAAGMGAINVSGLVASLDTMQAQMRLMLTPPQTASVSI
jgi:hypothetical protein